MRNASIIATILIVAVTAVCCLVIPAHHVISVGDDVSALRQIGRYGYSKSIFAWAPKYDPDGVPLTPSAYHLGDGWHLLIWHNDRVQSMCHFKNVPIPDSRHSGMADVRVVESSEVPRPSTLFYFVGLAVLFGIGFATQRFEPIFRRLPEILFTLFIVGNLIISVRAATVAIFPICVSIGWLVAFYLGAVLHASTWKSQDSTRSVAAPQGVEPEHTRG